MPRILGVCGSCLYMLTGRPFVMVYDLSHDVDDTEQPVRSLVYYRDDFPFFRNLCGINRAL